MQKSEFMKVAIIGGGVGGLTLALNLWKDGFKDILIFEANDKINELGVGINILPHAMRELSELGLLEQLLNVSHETSELQYYTHKGQYICGDARGKNAGYKWPQISIHRGSLINVLHQEVIKKLGSERIFTGSKLENFQRNNDGTVTAFFNGSSVTADCLIGCDGIHSSVRKILYPDQGEPKWCGITMWRGVSRVPPFAEGNPMIIAGKSEHRMVLYPISKRPDSDGKILINWIAKHKTDIEQEMPKQDWIHKVESKDLPKYFENFDFVNIKNLIKESEGIYKYPQVDRDPLPSWNFGNVTLLGDAAHPMYPSGSNGASQAIIDSSVLSKNLKDHNSINDAIKHYDSLRRPITEKITLMNRKSGPERCIDIVEERAPHGFKKLSDIVAKKELKEILNSYKKAAGFDKETLNTRSTLTAN